jgi:ATP-dependent DNA ligase
MGAIRQSRGEGGTCQHKTTPATPTWAPGPSLLAEIEYRAKSAAGKMRHPFFKGIRKDL